MQEEEEEEEEEDILVYNKPFLPLFSALSLSPQHLCVNRIVFLWKPFPLHVPCC